MCPFDMPLNNTGPVIVDILQGLVWHVNEGNVVQVPLMVVQSCQVRLMVQYVRRFQVGIGHRIRPRILRPG